MDTIKRAKSILAREKIENEHHPTVKAAVSAIENVSSFPLPAALVTEEREDTLGREDVSSSLTSEEDETNIVHEDVYDVQTLVETMTISNSNEETEEPKPSPPPVAKNKRRSNKKNKKWE